MKQTLYRFVSLAILLVMAAGLSFSCGPTEPDPDPTPATVAVTRVTLDKTSLDLIEGGTETLTATVSPDNATNKKVSWKSSDTAVATVDDNGKVTAVKAGSATITVTADGDKTATCSVKVTEQAKIMITGNTAKVPVQGGTAEFKIQYNTSYTVEIEQAAQSWLHFVETKAMQSGTLVFKVDANEGEARTGKATVKDNAGKVGAITLTFEQDPFIAVTSVQIDPETAELEEGKTLELTATVLPDNATDKTVTWSTDNEDVATVSEDGVVTALTEGTATIIATSGEKTATCSVTVTPSVYETERAALEAFYYATGGAVWTHKDNWCSDKPLGEWYGVKTDVFGRVVSLELKNNQLSGALPAQIADLHYLSTLNLEDNDLSGNIPDVIGDLSSLTELVLAGNRFSGEIPRSIGRLANLTTLDLFANSLSGQIPSEIGNLSSLQWLQLNSTLDPRHVNHLTGSLPESMRNLENLEFLGVAGNELEGQLPEWLGHLKKLFLIWLSDNNIAGSIPESIADLPELDGLVINGNRMSGLIPRKVFESDGWKNRWNPERYILPQQEGYGFTLDIYESTDYSHDGEVKKLQTHTEGKGINIVITGDIYTDRDFTSGFFDFAMNQAMEDLFSLEPYKSHRHLFDVYSVGAVSRNPAQFAETAFETYYGGGGARGDSEKVVEYALKAVADLDETLILVNINNRGSSGTTYMYSSDNPGDYGSGMAIVFYDTPEGEDGRIHLLCHEAGHGFAKLYDEYAYASYGRIPSESIPDASIPDRGWGKNIDYTSDPDLVKWSRFLKDERYKNEGVGIFEGGATYYYGVWRPSLNSIMNSYLDDSYNTYNAPSREAIWYRIHKLAFGDDWEYDYEEFVRWDMAYPAKQSSALATRANHVEVRDVSNGDHVPPVIINKTWRQVMAK